MAILIFHILFVCYLDVPPPPADLECIDRGRTHANLRWFPGKPAQDHGNGGMAVPVTSYTVILTDLDPSPGTSGKRKTSNISPWRINEDGSVHLKVTDLKPDKRYTAEVYAVSLKFGMSDPSNMVKFNTLEMRKLFLLQKTFIT